MRSHTLRPASRPRRGRRIALVALLSLAVIPLGLRAAIHRIPAFGPALADLLRAVVGADAVARLEEMSAKLDDGLKRGVRSRKAPRSLDELRTAQSPRGVPSTSAEPPAERALPRRPDDVGPMAARVAAHGDGTWAAVSNPARPHESTVLFTTMLHPDPKRSWSEAFVVAADVAHVRLHAVAGRVEPKATTRAGEGYVRSGLIPREHQSLLLAAFNGGFKTEHGRHGMFIDGTTLVPARAQLCTLFGYHDGQLAIATWKSATTEPLPDVEFYRQAAPCMYEGGNLNPRLRDEDTRNWGATLEGNVVIRRSAIGLDATRQFLYVGISNDTTARAMANAMHHAGATDVAQLDVNWSYPRFLLFRPRSDGELRAETLFKGFFCHEDDYLRRPSERDFFYLVRREGK